MYVKNLSTLFTVILIMRKRKSFIRIIYLGLVKVSGAFLVEPLSSVP